MTPRFAVWLLTGGPKDRSSQQRPSGVSSAPQSRGVSVPSRKWWSTNCSCLGCRGAPPGERGYPEDNSRPRRDVACAKSAQPLWGVTLLALSRHRRATTMAQHRLTPGDAPEATRMADVRAPLLQGRHTSRRGSHTTWDGEAWGALPLPPIPAC